jgi:ElaB/YqjD/DUF883 family membrane-anchored ribosome-binding protein
MNSNLRPPELKTDSGKQRIFSTAGPEIGQRWTINKKMKGKKDMYKQTKEIRNDLGALAEDVHALLGATADMAEEKVVEARKRLLAVLDNGKDAFSHLQARTVEGAKMADKVVRKHPYHSIGIAFGIGALIGLLLTWRKR